MKEKYLTPEMEIIVFPKMDVIVTSTGNYDDETEIDHP